MKKVETVPDGIIKATMKKRKPERVTRPDANHEVKMAETEFRCSACGTVYTNQDKNFMHSNSPFYAGNNHRITICNRCAESFLRQYQTILGTGDEAMRRLCLHLDIYVDEKLLAMTRTTDGKQSPIGSVKLAKLSLRTLPHLRAAS